MTAIVAWFQGVIFCSGPGATTSVLDLSPLFSFQCSVLPNLAFGAAWLQEVTKQESFHHGDCMTPRNLRRVFKRV